MRFLYFIAGNAAGRQFDALGLGDPFGGTGRQQSRINSDSSPTGMPGVVFHEPTSAGLPKPIEWCESNTGNFWFGWHAPNPPGPDDLRNGVGVDGWQIELGAGNEWMIPRVLPCRERILTRRSGLPYLIGRRDIESSSFSFAMQGGKEVFRRIDDGKTIREIVRVGQLYDVGPCTYPTYDATTTGLWSEHIADARAAYNQWKR